MILNRGAEQPEISVRLEDVDTEVTKLTCLDFWLENGTASLPAASPRRIGRLRLSAPAAVAAGIAPLLG